MRGFVLALAIVPMAAVLAHASQATLAQQPSSGALPSAPPVRETLNQYCVGCHNARLQTGGLALDSIDVNEIAARGDVWEKVVRKLRTGAMPPPGARRPDPAVARATARHLETALDRGAVAAPHPGRPLVHRLNRVEYANAVRDLLALDIDVAAMLPPDDSSHGFDNIADALGTSPSLIEAYLSAARKVSALAVGDPSIGPTSQTFGVRGDASQRDHVEGLPLGTRGGILVRTTLPLDGEYVFKVKLLQINLGSVRGLERPHQLEITVDGERVHLATVGGPEDYTASSENATNVVMSLDARLQVRVPVAAGPHTIGAAFLEKSAAAGGNRLQEFRRTTLIATDTLGLPHVENLTISGPFVAKGPGRTPSRDRIFTCRPASGSDNCARQIITTLARRAFRRQPLPTEVDRLMTVYRSAPEFERGIQLALRSILASPKFLLRVERDPLDSARGKPLDSARGKPLDSARGKPPGTPYRVTDLDLASRLSFFLWSSIPDDELLRVAEAGRLTDPASLERQVRRMLADPRAAALVTNFAGQWLYLRNVRASTPDKNAFPDFDDNLRQAFERETELFVGSVFREDRSVLELLNADFTYVNERLARHYGIPNVYGSRFRRVTVPDEARRGLLGQGSILLVTSHADRTSPVVRGKYILENILGTPPPPPPDVVPPLKDKADDGKPHSLRERMEDHRANPACAGCHKAMDPIGFALENFDAVGAWRTRDGLAAIDASGQLANGTPVDGVVTLREALLKDPDVFVTTTAEKLLTYALGRGLDHHDMPAVRAIVRHGAANGYRFSSLVMGVVTSVPFRTRE